MKNIEKFDPYFGKERGSKVKEKLTNRFSDPKNEEGKYFCKKN